MSSYGLNRFLYDLKMSELLLNEALSNLDAAASRYELSAEEKQALKSRDPRRLRQLGAHGMLALYIKRLDPEFRENIYWTQK